MDISVPAAVTVFPGEIHRAPRTWSEGSYHKLIYFNQVDQGGRFAGWEQPELFAAEIRAAFRSLREWRRARRPAQRVRRRPQRARSGLKPNQSRRLPPFNPAHTSEEETDE